MLSRNMNSLLTSDLLVRPEVIGLQALLAPFLNFTSSQRQEMWASHATQFCVVDGCEMPRVATGYEAKIGKYCFDYTTRNQDIRIVAVIPKFKTNIGSRQIRHNPTLTVVYVGMDDRKLNYIDIANYNKLSQGFGYINEIINQHELIKDNCIPKEMTFLETPDRDGDVYKQGVNANVAYLPLWATTQDAFIISDELAAKFEHTAIETVELDISPDDILLNLYGDDEDEYKIIPDIGESVGAHGILIGLRPKSKIANLADITRSALRDSQFLHDSIYSVPIGADIVDIQVHMNLDVFRSLRNNRESPFHQLIKYQEQHNDYYNEIVNVYKDFKRQGYQVSPEMNTLVTQCMGKAIPKNGPQPKIKLADGRDPIRFIHLEITYAYKRKVAAGNKLTGRYGDKGVISQIWKKADMPIDAEGIQADLIVVPGTNVNRMNPGQLFEQFLTRSCDIIQRRLLRNELGTDAEAYSHIMGFIHDIRPNYATVLANGHKNKSDREEFLEAVREDGIYLIINGFTESITPALVIKLADKYNFTESPVSWNVTYPDGSFKERVTSTSPVCIGSKYVGLLGKIPLEQLIATEIGFVSQFQTPIKPGDKAKNQSVIGQSCIRYGEDEGSMLLMALGGDITARHRGVYSGSPEALEKMEHLLLTADMPSAIMSVPMTTNEVIQTDRTVALFTHQMGAIGFEMSNDNESLTRRQ